MERPRRSPRGSFILGKAVSRRMSAIERESPVSLRKLEGGQNGTSCGSETCLMGSCRRRSRRHRHRVRMGRRVTGGHISVRAATTADLARSLPRLSEVCVDNFRHSPDAEANLASLTKIDSYDRHTFIEKGGWATMPGSKEPDQQQSSRFSSGCEGLGDFCAVAIWRGFLMRLVERHSVHRPLRRRRGGKRIDSRTDV